MSRLEVRREQGCATPLPFHSAGGALADPRGDSVVAPDVAVRAAELGIGVAPGYRFMAARVYREHPRKVLAACPIRLTRQPSELGSARELGADGSSPAQG